MVVAVEVQQVTAELEVPAEPVAEARVVEALRTSQELLELPTPAAEGALETTTQRMPRVALVAQVS